MKRVDGASGRGLMIERLPEMLLMDILSRLDLESLCSVSPVCRALRSLVSQSLSSIPSLDLSDFSPNPHILNKVLCDNKILQSLTFDCSQLYDFSLEVLNQEHLQELVLLKCSNFSSHIFNVIGEKCSNLRRLTLDMVLPEVPDSTCSKKAMAQMLTGCSHLEYLCIKFQRHVPRYFKFDCIQHILPKTLKILLLHPISDREAKLLISRSPLTDVGITCLKPLNFRLQSLTLVLNQITDELLISITGSLPYLAELCLEDQLLASPSAHDDDLTNVGVESLGSCKSLTRLSLQRRGRVSSFRRVNDIGILLLKEGCKGLESVRLAGFSKVTDAGYASILHSCKSLKRFEIINAVLSDLTFHRLDGDRTPLIEVRLVSCSLLTSESVISLSVCRGLEVLDLSGCKSVSDRALISASKLCKLTTLDLRGIDITDNALSALGGGSSPIASLCLRGCYGITDIGADLLLRGDGVIGRTLSALDLSYLARVSDKAVATVAEVCKGIVNLCIRHCVLLTDNSIMSLGSMGGSGPSSLQRLDICNCSGFSIDLPELLLARPQFRRLRWLGVWGTSLSYKWEDRMKELCRDQTKLSVCLFGCEMGCKDGWQYHKDF